MKLEQILTLGFVALLMFSAVEIAGDDVRVLVVLSSSMEPLMHPGDLVIVKKSRDIKVGDVVAFSDPTGKRELLITHRIIELGEGGIKTKGDAVEEPDFFSLTPEEIYGKLVFGIPYMGYFFHEFKNKNLLMYLAFILLPASVLTVSELRNLLKDERLIRRQEKLKRMFSRREKGETNPKPLLVALVAATVIFYLLLTPSLSVERISSGYRVTNTGMLSTYIFKEGAPYYDVVEPGESTAVAGSFDAVNGVLPLIWLYSLYTVGVLYLTPILLSSILTIFLIYLKNFYTKRTYSRW